MVKCKYFSYTTRNGVIYNTIKNEPLGNHVDLYFWYDNDNSFPDYDKPENYEIRYPDGRVDPLKIDITHSFTKYVNVDRSSRDVISVSSFPYLKDLKLKSFRINSLIYNDFFMSDDLYNYKVNYNTKLPIMEKSLIKCKSKLIFMLDSSDEYLRSKINGIRLSCINSNIDMYACDAINNGITYRINDTTLQIKADTENISFFRDSLASCEDITFDKHIISHSIAEDILNRIEYLNEFIRRYTLSLKEYINSLNILSWGVEDFLSNLTKLRYGYINDNIKKSMEV